MWVPPYFGSAEHLLEELLQNPFLGGGGQVPYVPRPVQLPPGHHNRSIERDETDTKVALSFVLTAAGLKEAASRLEDKNKAAEITAFVDSAVADFLDDYCGTPPHPWPGPPWWWVSSLVSQLTLAANSLQKGALQESLGAYATRALAIGVASGREARQFAAAKQ